MKRVSVLSAVLLSTLFAGAADAAPITVNGYICSASYTRQPNLNLGLQGFVGVTVRSGVGCTGADLGHYYYLGESAAFAGYQYSEAERLQLFEQAKQAATQQTRVTLSVEGTDGKGILHTTYLAN
ncbi:hypothetical protein [Pyxidicoccus xibeiensis]|uniref:hypothetical protein n=1 Tax=Pyxidicoccus xibeiensis TaxID=2906759 RepID=UPI0020A6FD5B|nr:hypothetical protein [Pyxidicoccus xibeiensis]MCP3139128.1 hypothetical protein [Pyxidicoccus xibeiensis]